MNSVKNLSKELLKRLLDAEVRPGLPNMHSQRPFIVGYATSEGMGGSYLVLATSAAEASAKVKAYYRNQGERCGTSVHEPDEEEMELDVTPNLKNAQKLGGMYQLWCGT